MSLFELMYDLEAPYPRIVADTGKLAEARRPVEVVPAFHVAGGDHALQGCCTRAENLERKDSGRPDMLLTVCRRCGRRHFKGLAEGGRMGMR